jgi:ribosomal protein L13E
VRECLEAGYNEEECAGGFSAADWKADGFDASKCAEVGFTPMELRAAGFTSEQLLAAGMSADKLKNAGASAEELRRLGQTAHQLRTGGYGVTELHDAGYPVDEVFDAGFTLEELRDAGYAAAQMIDLEEFTPQAARDAGFALAELVDAFDAIDLTSAFTAAEMTPLLGPPCDVPYLNFSWNSAVAVGTRVVCEDRFGTVTRAVGAYVRVQYDDGSENTPTVDADGGFFGSGELAGDLELGKGVVVLPVRWSSDALNPEKRATLAA